MVSVGPFYYQWLYGPPELFWGSLGIFSVLFSLALIELFARLIIRIERSSETTLLESSDNDRQFPRSIYRLFVGFIILLSVLAGFLYVRYEFIGLLIGYGFLISFILIFYGWLHSTFYPDGCTKSSSFKEGH